MNVSTLIKELATVIEQEGNRKINFNNRRINLEKVVREGFGFRIGFVSYLPGLNDAIIIQTWVD